MAYDLKDENTTDDGFYRIGVGGITARDTSFTAGSNYTLNAAAANLVQENSPVGNSLMYAYADDGAGAPGSLLATSDAVAIGDIPTSGSAPAFVLFVFSSSPASLTNATRYHLAIRGQGSGDGYGAAGNLRWHVDTSETGQDVYNEEASTWILQANNRQLNFKTYEESGGGGRTVWIRSGLDGHSIEGIKQFNPSLSYHRHPMLSLAAYRRERARAHRSFLAKVQRAA